MIEENGFGAIGIGNTAGNPIASMRAVGGLPLVSVLNENGIDLAGMHDLWFKRFYEY